MDISIIYFDEGVQKHHHRNGRWGEHFELNKQSAEEYSDEEFEYDTPREMAIATAETLMKRPGIDEVRVFTDGDLDRIYKSEPEHEGPFGI